LRQKSNAKTGSVLTGSQGAKIMSRHNDLTNMMDCRLFRGMSEAECSSIRTVVKPVTFGYRKKEAIMSQGDIVSYISLVVKGRVIGVRYYYGGDSHILRVFDEMDVLCLEAAMSSFQKSPITLIADEACEILSFSITRLMDKNFLDETIRNKIHENIFHLLADENIRLIYKAEVLSQKSLRERIMIFLRIMKEKKDRDSFYIGMNQEQFAQYLGANRSALSAELNEMRREGIIDYSRDYFTLLYNINK
jgi:CRP/FNR family transcriptional regulator, dissimilatory nitrate respiration regulator